MESYETKGRRHFGEAQLTAHYYAMGPAGSAGATLDQLAEADPKQATMHEAGFAVVAQAMKISGLPFRMSEGNSCWNGGQPGVSDTFASALWCADTMLRFAALGWCGVNLHGGGSGIYTPLAGAPSTGFSLRPEYFGMQFAQSFAGANLLAASLTGSGPHTTAYVVENQARRRVAIINKDNGAVNVELPARAGTKAWRLSGPSLESKEGTMFGEVAVARSSVVTVPSHTSMIYEI